MSAKVIPMRVNHARPAPAEPVITLTGGPKPGTWILRHTSPGSSLVRSIPLRTKDLETVKQLIETAQIFDEEGGA